MTRLALALVLVAVAPGCRRKLAHQPPAPAAPSSSRFAERRVAPGTLDLYVDEKLQRTLAAKELGTEQTLAQVIGNVHARSVLAHGEGEVWVAGGELADFGLRLNRRGAIKLERLQQAEGGGGGGGRAGDVRDLQWLEVRTPSSPRLPGEP
jgi:hypothetical protein